VEGKKQERNRGGCSGTVLGERRMRKRENRGSEQKEERSGEGRLSLLVLMSSSGLQGMILDPIIPWFFISCKRIKMNSQPMGQYFTSRGS
jgi:hypothetical protein